MDAFTPATGGRGCRRWTLRLAALAAAGIGLVQAQVVQVPDAHLHHAEGTVAHAPQGEREWQDVLPRRVLQRGDRLWTDRGSRAELQAGGHALRMDGQTQIVLDNVADTATQVSLTQGTLAATVAGLQPGDEFEVGTPNLALRARTEGDYRIDVDPKQGTTRVAVLTGVGVVYGEKGEAMEIRAGQRVTFRARNLARVQQGAFVATDDFDHWAAARRRGEPTVRMPQLAQSAPSPAPSSQLVHRGPDLVIAGPPSALPGARPSGAPKVLPPAPAVPPPIAKAQPIPTMPVGPALPAAVPLRVNAQAAAQAAAQAQQAQQAQEARDTREAKRAEERQRAVAARRAEEEKRTAQAKREREARRVEAARKAEEARRIAAAKKAEEARRVAAQRQAEDARRVAAAKKAEETRRAAARKAADEQRMAAARKAEEARLADARRKQLARLQEQARREEQSVQARREEQRRREEQAWREEQARREEQSRREETARREEAMRQRAVAEEARRDHERREQEVWLRQRQQQVAPSRPVPMGVPVGVPARRVS